MFVVEAICSFSEAVLGLQNEEKEQKREQHQQKDQQQEISKHKRGRTKEQEQDLVQCAQEAEKQKGDQKYKSTNEQKSQAVHYLSFNAGDKIFVQQAYENGWWYGNVIGKPEDKGFFPSNYVKTGAKPLPPKPKQAQKKQEEAAVYDPQQPDWMTKKLQEVNEQKEEGEGGAVNSQYYHGIKGFKYVKIDEKNKNILNGNYVKFDVNTGLARVPVKDQAPAAKAVRQMGYYFDYHQWGEQRNKNPNAFKARPDPKKKKPKKLNLKFMN